MEEKILETPVAEVVEPVVETGKKKGKGTAVLVLAILALITTLFFINYIFGIIAIILAIVFLKDKTRTEGRKKVITGLVIASVSLVLSTALWGYAYYYFTNTPLTQVLEDVSTVTGGAVDVKEVVSQEIEKTVENIEGIEQIEEALGKEIDYELIEEFVGEDLSLQKVTAFVGDGDIDVDKAMEVVEKVDYEKLVEDLDGEITYKKLEDKVGKDFSYDELMEYLSQFEKK